MTQREFEDRYTDYPFNPIGHGRERVSQHADADGFIEVAEAPNGFMCVKRGVFRRMMEAYPNLRLHAGRPARPPGGASALALLRLHGRSGSGRYLSEDFAFCRLWRDIGGKVFVDLECKLNHLGQHMYRGDLAESLRAQGRW